MVFNQTGLGLSVLEVATLTRACGFAQSGQHHHLYVDAIVNLSDCHVEHEYVSSNLMLIVRNVTLLACRSRMLFLRAVPPTPQFPLPLHLRVSTKQLLVTRWRS